VTYRSATLSDTESGMLETAQWKSYGKKRKGKNFEK